MLVYKEGKERSVQKSKHRFLCVQFSIKRFVCKWVVPSDIYVGCTRMYLQGMQQNLVMTPEKAILCSNVLILAPHAPPPPATSPMT